MALAFNERQFWTNRISKTVDRKIEELRSSSSAIIDIFKIRAEQELTDKLQISDDLAAYEDRKEEIEELEASQKEILAMLAVTVYGDEPPYHVSLADIKREVTSMIAEKTDELFAEHPLGMHLQVLKSTKKSLMDAVLLAKTLEQIEYQMDKADALDVFPELPAESGEDGSEEEPMLRLSDYSLQ